MAMIVSLAACKKKPQEDATTELPAATVEKTAEEAFHDAMTVVRTRLSGFSFEKENIQKQIEDLKDKQIKDVIKVNQDIRMDIKLSARVRANREINDIRLIGGFATDTDSQAAAINIGAYTNAEPSLESSLFADLKNTQLYTSRACYDCSAYGSNGIADNSEWEISDFQDLFELKVSELIEYSDIINGVEGVIDNAKEGLSSTLWTVGLFGGEVASEDRQIAKTIAAFEWSNIKDLVKRNLKFTGTAKNGQAIFEMKLSEMIIPLLKDMSDLSHELQQNTLSEEEIAELEDNFNTSFNNILDFFIEVGDPKIVFTVSFSEIGDKLRHISINLEVDKLQFDKDGETKLTDMRISYFLSFEDQTLHATDHMKNNGKDITEDIKRYIDRIK